MQDLQLMPRQENPALAERRQARELPVLSWRVQQAVAAPPQHASNEQASPTRPPPDAASPMTEPQKPPTNGFSKVGDTASSTVIGSGASLGSSTSVGINSGSSSSTGPLRANASDLLAGVPLDAMRERQQAAQQLQRQQQQLGGGPANGPTPTSAAAPPPGTNGSLWGSTTGPAAAPAAAKQPLVADSGSLRAELSPVTSPEAAVAFAAYEQAVGSRRLVPVRLTLQLQAAEGQRLKVVGGHKSLGKWALDAALEMRRTEGDTWEATVQLPAGSVTEYKYALVDAAGRPVALQAGNNGVLAVGFADERLEVLDSWAGDAAGVSVVVDGDRGAWPATRESRLVSWANELFQQVASLRQDLRNSRMELVGTQEEVRGAQLEAARLAGELEAVRASMSELEAERAADRAELAQAKALNSALQAQLADTTASLKEAIEMAGDLMAAQAEDEPEEAGDDGEYGDEEEEDEVQGDEQAERSASRQ